MDDEDAAAAAVDARAALDVVSRSLALLSAQQSRQIFALWVLVALLCLALAAACAILYLLAHLCYALKYGPEPATEETLARSAARIIVHTANSQDMHAFWHAEIRHAIKNALRDILLEPDVQTIVATSLKETADATWKIHVQRSKRDWEEMWENQASKIRNSMRGVFAPGARGDERNELEGSPGSVGDDAFDETAPSPPRNSVDDVSDVGERCPGESSSPPSASLRLRQRQQRPDPHRPQRKPPALQVESNAEET